MSAEPVGIADAFRRSHSIIAVQPWLVKAVGPGPAVWLSQVMYRMQRDDVWTLVAPDHDWEGETGLARTQVFRARQKIAELGWITSEVRKVAGAPTCQITFNPEAFEEGYRAIHFAESRDPGSRENARTSTTPDGSLEGESTDRAEGLFQHEPEATPTPPSDDEAFFAFWAAYPRKVGKPAARRAWPKAVRAAGGADVIVAAAERYATERAQEDPRYTKHPGPWLNDERWNDPPARRRLRERQTGGPGSVIGRSGETGARVMTTEELFG